MVEMPINGGKYHQTSESHWISHLVDNLPLNPVMVGNIAYAELSNPRQIRNSNRYHHLSFVTKLLVDVP